MPKLINKRIGAEYYIVTDPASIGRHPSNDIILPGSTISRFHARIGMADGEYYIRDLGSTYGTFVNGRRVECKEDVLVTLKDGDRIALGVSSSSSHGEYDLIFSTEEVPAEAAAGIREAIAKRAKVENGRIAIEEEGGVVVVKLNGAFRGPECDAVVDAITAQVRSRPLDVVIDLGNVTYMNSYVLGTFVKLQMNLQELGRALALASASGHVSRLLEVAGLSAMFGHCPSVEEASEALRERSRGAAG